MQHCDCGTDRAKGGSERGEGIGGGGGKGRVEVETLSMRSRPEIGEGTAGMRNRPVKPDPKLTVLLYVLTRRGGFRPHRAPPAALSSPALPHPPLSAHPILLVSPRRRAASPRRSRYEVERWNRPERFRGNSRPRPSTSAETICELQTESCRVELFPTAGHDR